jgi:hypothetical protein
MRAKAKHHLSSQPVLEPQKATSLQEPWFPTAAYAMAIENDYLETSKASREKARQKKSVRKKNKPP